MWLQKLERFNCPIAGQRKKVKVEGFKRGNVKYGQEKI